MPRGSVRKGRSFSLNLDLFVSSLFSRGPTRVLLPGVASSWTQSRKAGAGAQSTPSAPSPGRLRASGGWAGPAEFSRERAARKLQAPSPEAAGSQPGSSGSGAARGWAHPCSVERVPVWELVLPQELWSECRVRGLCTQSPVSQWLQTKHKGREKKTLDFLTPILVWFPWNCKWALLVIHAGSLQQRQKWVSSLWHIAAKQVCES